ncbi:MAG: 3-phosphoshikimate 1-carboxyvinyltransferase [Winogradskyella sp.]
MTIHIQKSEIISPNAVINITGSKSESNRLLLLKALYPQVSVKNLSISDDTELMQNALQSKEAIIDINHAGTAMRFLTAYFAVKDGREVSLTGSSRMKQRPIQLLVEALKTLGADIEYLENKGFPPLKIVGKTLTENQIELEASISSQYISALLLIGSKLKNGITLTLKGKITSMPYINMTLSLLNKVGVKTHFFGNTIEVKPIAKHPKPITITVESDWSSASYFYSIVALSGLGTTVQLASFTEHSLQGDAVSVDIYKQFGVETTFSKNTVTLQKIKTVNPQISINLDLSNMPDIAQTIAVTAFGLGLNCYLTGLHTLKIKETDRLQALKTELEKLGATVTITSNSLYLKACNAIKSKITIATYHDHRMAMAFAPLALKVPILIKDAEVVSKSYPQFWEDFKHLGFSISKLNKAFSK